ncbi:unnamed protein product [Clonostachys rosea f. rosea IK726]|uniref:Uncharacterized protein n=1 Tax=Clonostachys rosea f. rosea IK726 TaxID=1349383 RepID=A0ACA9UPA3_BIOOC|nr:unnamed protein product [Clonostachys rosea f. rosea IK726]
MHLDSVRSAGYTLSWLLWSLLASSLVSKRPYYTIDEFRDTQTHSTTTSREEGETYIKYSYLEQLKLWGYRDPQQPNNFFKFIFIPIYLLRYPSIVFSGLLMGSILAWYNMLLIL